MPYAEVNVLVTDPIDLRYLIAKNGYQVKELAEKLDVAPSTISGVIAGKSTSEPIETAVSEVTGLTLEEVQMVTRKGQRQRRERKRERRSQRLRRSASKNSG